jgi:hypothetical protein
MSLVLPAETVVTNYQINFTLQSKKKNWFTVSVSMTTIHQVQSGQENISQSDDLKFC